MKRRRLFSSLGLGSLFPGLLLAQTKIKTNQSVTISGTQTWIQSIIPGSQLTSNPLTLASTPAQGSLVWITRNGLLQAEGVDYTISGKAITFLFFSSFSPDDTFIVRYSA